MSTIRILASALVALAVAAAPAAAQKNCKKGIPCGNSCISASKTCRIGSSSPPRTTTPAPRTTAPTAAAKPRASTGSSTATSSQVAPLIGTPAQWVAATDGKVYYARACPLLADIDSTDMRFFYTEVAAEAAGYARSKARGC